MRNRPVSTPAAIDLRGRFDRVRLAGILLCAFVIYAPSLSGGFLNYDDDWMVKSNAIYQSLEKHDFWTIWCDLSQATRLLLGAEYLPVRDTSVLLDVYLFGMSPQWMRTINLLWYLAASCFCVLSWRRLLGRSWPSDFIAAFFIFHPVHAESVAWIVGRKDVLGLAFFWAAVWVHHGPNKQGSRGMARIGLVCGLLLLAQLSKFLFVTAPLLVVFMDYCGRKLSFSRKAVSQYGSYAFVCFGAALLQLHIGEVTTMVGARDIEQYERLLTMGPVWWGYFKSAFFGIDLNVMHDVLPRHEFFPDVALGYALVLLGCLGALYVALTSNQRLGVAGWFCLLVPLLPVSQLIVPIQNFHEDRYLVLSVMGPGMMFADLINSGSFLAKHELRARILACSLLTFLGVHAAQRAWLFANPIRLFQDATAHSSYSSSAPYQLGLSYEHESYELDALRSYHQALTRPNSRSETTRRATNNLARLYAKQGNHAQAEHYLRRGRLAFPNDPKLLGNLAEVMWLSGRKVEARALYEDLVRRFPDYQRGRTLYLEHFNGQ